MFSAPAVTLSLTLYTQDISKLTLLRSQSERQLHLSDRVTLKKAELAPITQHGKEEDPAGVLHVQTLAVRETETTIDVLWQDGTKETLMGKTFARNCLTIANTQ